MTRPLPDDDPERVGWHWRDGAWTYGATEASTMTVDELREAIAYAHAQAHSGHAYLFPNNVVPVCTEDRDWADRILAAVGALFTDEQAAALGLAIGYTFAGHPGWEAFAPLRPLADTIRILREQATTVPA